MRLRICNIRERLAVDLLCDFAERRMLGFAIGPGKIDDWIRELASFGLVKVANLEEDLSQDVLIQAALARGGTATFFQFNQRAELVMEPSFSANPAQGSR
jgi:hypothetical protein